MKAAVWHGKEDVRVEQVSEPKTPNNKVKIKVERAGICGSDLHIYYWGLAMSHEPHPITGEKAPIIMGHEFGGQIVEIGKDVKTTLKVGDRVAVEPNIYRADDPMVKKGKYNLSEDAAFVGISSNGGFAEYCLLDAHQLHKIPNGVSFEEAALVEPTAVAFQAVLNSAQKLGDQVLVYGVGPIGQLTVMCAKMAGATTVIAVDISEERLEMAKNVGATHVVNGKDENVLQQILEISDGGVDVAYECSGVQIGFTNSLKSVVKGGQVMVVAAYGADLAFDATGALIAEKNITTSIGYRNVYPQVIRAIANKQLDVRKIVTKEIELKDIVKQGFEVLHSSPKHSKILVKP